jgi:ribonuclease HI
MPDGQKLLDGLSGYHSLYTDGSLNTARNAGGYAVIALVNRGGINYPEVLTVGAIAGATNNIVELAGIGEAMLFSPTLIYSDSRYAIGTLAEWSDKWRANGWARSAGPIANLAIVKTLNHVYNTLQTHSNLPTLLHVKGHAGNIGNEAADSESRNFIDRADSIPSISAWLEGYRQRATLVLQSLGSTAPIP